MQPNYSVNDLEDRVVDFVQAAERFVPFHVIVAFVEQRLGIPAHGDASVASPDDPNRIVWPYLSPELADAIISAVAKRRLFLVPALAEQYANTGADLRDDGFTVIDYDHPPTGGTGPFWVPMTLSSRPLIEKPPPFMTEEEVAAYR